MKRLLVLLAFVAGCNGLLSRARSVLDQAVADEQTLTALCEAVAEETGRVPDKCDEAWDLYEQMQADVAAIKAEMAKPSPDEAVIAGLVFRLEQNGRKLAELVAELSK